ncbi:MAG: DNA-3-methyladenine glycosylase [Candidatus Acidiferrales bacterium]
MPIEPHVLHTHREAIAHLKRVDPRLARAIDRIVEIIGPFDMKMAGHPGPYEALLRSIFYQQLNGRAAATILGRFKDRFGSGDFPAPAKVLAASTRQLRSVGLSRQKIAAVRDLARKTLDGTVPPQAEIELLSNEEIIERLTAVRGVGVWTVEMLLMFQLGRPNVLPVSDFGVRKGFQVAFGKKKMPTPKELSAHGERWQPYRTIASWYLWRASEHLSPKNAKPAARVPARATKKKSKSKKTKR